MPESKDQLDHLPSWTSQALLNSLSGLNSLEKDTNKEGEYRTVNIKDISAALACPLCQGSFTFYMASKFCHVVINATINLNGTIF